MAKRPPEIPASKWAGYSPSYKARLSNFYEKHPGASVQSARGHAAAEHITRAERLNARMDALAARQEYRASGVGGKSKAELLAHYKAKVKEEGEIWFRNYEKKINDLNAAWVKAGKPYSHDKTALHIDLEGEGEDLDVDDTDLFYH